MTFHVEPQTIFLTLAGSQAHGTATQGSDVDLRGVCVAPLQSRLRLFSSFEQYEGPLEAGLERTIRPRLEAHATAVHGLNIKVECVVFDIAKFIKLCAEANPNALEILFADEADWMLETRAWRRLHTNRHQFLTKKVQQTFLGYAMAQLKKIKSHRSWLLAPPTKKPNREDFGLSAAQSALSGDDQNRIEQSIAEKLRTYGIDDIDMPKHARVAVHERMEGFMRDFLAVPSQPLDAIARTVATHALRLPADVVSGLTAEKKYRAAMKQWDSYQAWQSQRNPRRAELEQRHGYDTKHAMHLVRLMRMGLEALQHGELLVRRPDAAELRAIRDGAMSFDELTALARTIQVEIETAARLTKLPDDVDREAVEALAYEMMMTAARE